MPEIFSPEINWVNPLIEEHEYETLLFSGYDDTDQRSSLMDIPHRRLTYYISALDARESGLLEGLIRKIQGERCYVPYWRGARYLISRVDTVAGDDLFIADPAAAGFETGELAMLFLD